MTMPRVLVVDDEPVVTRSCQRILGEEGYQVATAQCGREGRDRILRERFDLVVTDLKMPDLDGMELVRTLRGGRPPTAVVVITGYGAIASAVEATKLGVADYVEKPFTPDQIVQAASRALRADEVGPEDTVDAEHVRQVLRKVAEDQAFGERLLNEGSRVLSGYALSSEAKAAIVSGDLAWIEKACGELSSQEREWLQRRLEVEAW